MSKRHGDHEITVSQTLHRGGSAEAVHNVVGEIRLPEQVRPGNVAPFPAPT